MPVHLNSRVTLGQLRALAAFRPDFTDAPAPSKAEREQVRRMQGHLGVPLLDPDATDGDALTPVGAELAARAHRCLQELEPAGPDGLRFACYPAQFVHAAPLLRSFRADTAVRVEVVPISDQLRIGDGAKLRTLLVRRHAEVAIVPGDFRVDGYSSEGTLYEWQLVALAATRSTPWSGPSVELADVCQRSLAVAPPGHRSRTVLTVNTDIRRIQPRIVVETADPHVLCPLPTVSDLVALMPSDAVHPNPDVTVTDIVDGGRALGGSYTVAHLTTNPLAEKLARHLHAHWPACRA